MDVFSITLLYDAVCKALLSSGITVIRLGKEITDIFGGNIVCWQVWNKKDGENEYFLCGLLLIKFSERSAYLHAAHWFIDIDDCVKDIYENLFSVLKGLGFKQFTMPVLGNDIEWFKEKMAMDTMAIAYKEL